MIRDNEDIEEQAFDVALSFKDKAFNPIAYTKTNKLITALYIVTDVIDKEEPLRHKLRTLGSDIISDIYSDSSNSNYHINKIGQRVDAILSFLDIAGALNLVSEMNSSILKKEFLELKQSIKGLNRQGGLAELLKEEPIISNQPMRIGVQRGNTLMKALSKIEVSDKVPNLSNRVKERPVHEGNNNFNVLKKQRREEITNIVKDNPGGLTITDIKQKAQSMPLPAQALNSCSEKTLQRELISMVKDGVLTRTGEKRWSKYFLTAN